MSNGGQRESAEDQSERIDRELIELLNELRVALPGVQVLFAFLLTVPFSPFLGWITVEHRRFGAFRKDVRSGSPLDLVRRENFLRACPPW